MTISTVKLLKLLFLTISASIVFSAFTIKNETADYDDGPYIFIDNNKGIEKRIVSGKVMEKEVDLDLIHFTDEQTYYNNVENIAALSDIHGQLGVLKKILRANNIIDSNDNWRYGKGHFVITGDIFDRGPQVTETLWFVYELEKQAFKAGGKVHFLLGNHEYMILHEDIRYLHEKYSETMKLLNCNYKDLFGINTVLGRWLRSKATIIKINDKIFVHGGLSQAFVDLKISLDETNNIFRKTIDITREDIKKNEMYNALYSSNGPIWYRGYFVKPIGRNDLLTILSHYNAKGIIVGHTSQSRITEAYDGLVYAIDSSIKNGKKGEMLFIENETFYRGTMKGKKVKF